MKTSILSTLLHLVLSPSPIISFDGVSTAHDEFDKEDGRTPKSRIMKQDPCWMHDVHCQDNDPGRNEGVTPGRELLRRRGEDNDPGRCGDQVNGKSCPNNLCCSEFGYCGSTSAYCAGGCQSGPCTDEEGQDNRNYCGKSWDDADASCDRACPLGTDAECTRNNRCYANAVSCPAVQHQTTFTPTYSPTSFPIHSWDGDGFDDVRPGTKTVNPTPSPTLSPSISPTLNPSTDPTMRPTRNPTGRPTKNPTRRPTKFPTRQPTKNPTNRPAKITTRRPSKNPTKRPTKNPTGRPTPFPTKRPTWSASQHPARDPTKRPTRRPSYQPTKYPTKLPTKMPTKLPTTRRPSTPFPTMRLEICEADAPCDNRGSQCTFGQESCCGATFDSNVCTCTRKLRYQCVATNKCRDPWCERCTLGSNECAKDEYCAVDDGQCLLKIADLSGQCRPLRNTCRQISMSVCGCDDSTYPNADCAKAAGINVAYEGACDSELGTESTLSPTTNPTASPTASPTISPSTSPTLSPSVSPTISPSVSPTVSPMISPTASPSATPTVSSTVSPTASPTISPSTGPTLSPSVSPTISPSVSPTVSPTLSPSTSPTVSPTKSPTMSLWHGDGFTENPTTVPTVAPTLFPTFEPSFTPTMTQTRSQSPSMVGLLPIEKPSKKPFHKPVHDTWRAATSTSSSTLSTSKSGKSGVKSGKSGRNSDKSRGKLGKSGSKSGKSGRESNSRDSRDGNLKKMSGLTGTQGYIVYNSSASTATCVSGIIGMVVFCIQIYAMNTLVV